MLPVTKKTPLMRATGFLLVLITCSFSQRAICQEEFVPPPARKITTIPFRLLSGGIVTLRARVGNYPDTLTFVLDTGSSGISLDSSTVDYLGVPAEVSDRTIRGIAGIRRVKFAYNQTLHLPGLSIDSMNFHINDYDILTSAYGEKIDGIIGYSFLSRYIVKVDYDSTRLEVFTKGTIKYPRGGFLLRPNLVNLPLFGADLKDEKEIRARFLFDLGAGMCLLLTNDFVTDSLFIKTKRKWYATQAEGVGGKAAMKIGVIKQVHFGPYKFRNVPTYIFDDDYNVFSYPSLAGLIGNDLLRRFNLIINYDKRDIYMIPNSHFKDKFDYAYTGLTIYLVENDIVAVDIMPGSPAEKAGFQQGDVILSINNAFKKSLQTYKSLMETPGEKLRILVLREGTPLILTMKVISVL